MKPATPVTKIRIFFSDQWISVTLSSTVQNVKVSGKKLLYVINDFSFLMSHRRYLVESAMAAGHEVALIAPGKGADYRADGIIARRISWPLSRKGRNPITELRTFLSLAVLLWRERPDVVHAITIKPVIYTGILSRLLRFRVVASISGMGFTYVSRGLVARGFRLLVDNLYRLALRRTGVTVIFQNPDDRAYFLENRLIGEAETRLIPGVGVDLSEFDVPPPSSEKPVFVLPARILSSKGVREFATAAKSLKPRYPDSRFALVGSFDPDNPHAIPPAEVDDWVHAGFLEYWGFRQDMPVVYSQTSVIVLPSYREGFSRVLMEAAASGRAIVATDVPGCRDAVSPGENGYLVPARDAPALEAAIEKFILDRELIGALGRASRRIAEERFAQQVLTAPVLNLY